jgi:hypothetical protein
MKKKRVGEGGERKKDDKRETKRGEKEERV